MTARKKPDGTWFTDFLFSYPDGRKERIRKKSPVQTRQGTLEYERQLRAEMLANRPKPRLTLEVWEEYLDYCRDRFRATNADNKAYLWGKHLAKLVPEYLSDIDQGVIDRVSRYLSRETDLSPKSVINVLTNLRAFTSFAAERGWVQQRISYRMPETDPTLPEFLSFSDYAKLIGSLQGDLLTVALLGGDAGLRRGEIAGLQWRDIVGSAVVVQRSVQGGNIQGTKSRRIRTVPLTRRLAEQLRDRETDTPWVLTLPDGSFWRRETFRWRGPVMYRLAGLSVPKQPLHVLRHTFCSHLAMRGVPATVIQQLAGHSSLSVTERYMHLSPGYLAGVVGVLEGDSWHGTLLAPSFAESGQDPVSSGKDSLEVLASLVTAPGFKESDDK